MVPTTLHRRRLLRSLSGVAAAGVTAVAGCSSRPSSSTPTRTERPSVPYDSLFVRNPGGEPFVEFTDDDGETESDGVTARLSSTDDADRVAFGGDVDGVDDARAFLDATEFETETVLLVEQVVGECHELLVDYVTTSDDSFDVDFCRRLRPADVDCSTEARDVVLGLVRFRFSGNASSYTVGSGGSCERRGRGEER